MRFFSDAQRQEKTGKKHLPKKQPPARIFTRFFSDAQRQEKTGKNARLIRHAPVNDAQRASKLAKRAPARPSAAEGKRAAFF